MNDLQMLGTVFAALLGLAFGSFLNVVLTRLPEDESIASPGSHCRHCEHTLAWWENLPLLSLLILRGRCRQCRTWIGLRYPLIELGVALLWTILWIRFSGPLFASTLTGADVPRPIAEALTLILGNALLCWMLVALAALDAEHFWLPDLLTLPGVAFGIVFSLLLVWCRTPIHRPFGPGEWLSEIGPRLLEALLAAGVVLLIRLVYWLVRRKEGMGLGDAKLMAMLGAWLGLLGAIESFALAVLLATVAALGWLIVMAVRGRTSDWAKMPLPLGTFLCLAGLSEVFYPDWPWSLWSRVFLP